MRQPNDGHAHPASHEHGDQQSEASALPPLMPDLETLDLNILRDWLDASSFSDDDDSESMSVSSMDIDDHDPLLQLLQQHAPHLASAGLMNTKHLLSMAQQYATSGISNRTSSINNRTSSSSTSTSTGTGNNNSKDRKKPAKTKAPPASPSTSSTHNSASDDEPRKTWPNQREELSYLRVKVCELENQLQEIKYESRKQFKTQALARITSADAQGMVACSTPAALWEQVANRQLDEKNRAEVENRKLRGMVEAQIRLAKKLQQLLRKRQARTLSFFMRIFFIFGDDIGLMFLLAIWEGLMEKESKYEGHLKPEESKIYGFLAQRIEERYPYIDAFFEELGMTRVANEAREVNVKYDENNSDGGIMYLEMKECKLMPFDFRLADNAVWRCLKAEIIQMQNTSATILEGDDENVLRAKVAVNIVGRGSEVELTVWSYWQRFVEADRIVYTVESLGITGGGTTPGTPIIQLKQSATAVIRQLQQTSAPVASIIKVYMRSTPSIIQDLDLSAQETHSGVDLHPQVGVLTDMLIGSYQQNIESIYKSVENLLLDDMFKMARRGGMN